MTARGGSPAAVIVAAAGAAVADITIDTDPDGYAELVAPADPHCGLREWSIEGTAGYSTGLARHLAERGELVIELDRPNRPALRNGAMSDPLDAVRKATKPSPVSTWPSLAPPVSEPLWRCS